MKKQKNHSFIVLVVTIFFIVPTLLAQSNENKILGYIGVSSTNISERDYWSSETSFGMGLDLNINDVVSFLSFVEFSYLPINEENVKKRAHALDVNSVNIRIDRGTVYMFSFSGNIKYKILSSKIITPYLIAGLGFFVAGTDGVADVRGSYLSNPLVERSILGIDHQEEAFSSNFGAGAEIEFSSKFGMFIDVQYLIGFTENIITSFPIRMGITYKL